ncbi:MAG: extracellular solute-binding protein [Amaricoccus sp.]|uniref:ABC transporter substrate-binding protein n=1 Tax=Amaricoccus sp. TaxID=1872485 RepID=UPI0039E6F3B1
MKGLLVASVGASFGAAALLAGSAAWADCGIEKGSVRILSNDFEALHIVASGAEECASATVTVTKNQTTEHKTIQVPALTTDPATYTVAMVANNSIVPLLNGGLIRPLDEYVAKWGQQLTPNQLVKVDGKVMGIAFMINDQHVVYRKDLLEQAGVQPPKTYEDILAAAQALRDKGIMQDPLAANFKPGWDLAEEFVNMYQGYGGEFFEPGTAKLAIDNKEGAQALATLKAMSGFMSRDFVTYDTNSVKPIWEAGKVAIATVWGSRVGAFVDAEGAAPGVSENSVVTEAPTVGGGTVPASSLWWDGFAIAGNISDEDAEASFRAMMHGIRPEVAKAHPDVTAWLIAGAEPTPALAGVFATAKAGARPYPMLPYMGILHTALGNELAEYMQGQEDAKKALADVTQAYNTAAKENGFLN